MSCIPMAKHSSTLNTSMPFKAWECAVLSAEEQSGCTCVKVWKLVKIWTNGSSGHVFCPSFSIDRAAAAPMRLQGPPQLAAWHLPQERTQRCRAAVRLDPVAVSLRQEVAALAAQTGEQHVAVKDMATGGRDGSLGSNRRGGGCYQSLASPLRVLHRC